MALYNPPFLIYRFKLVKSTDKKRKAPDPKGSGAWEESPSRRDAATAPFRQGGLRGTRAAGGGGPYGDDEEIAREEPPVSFADSPLLQKGARGNAGPARPAAPTEKTRRSGPPGASAPTEIIQNSECGMRNWGARGRGKPLPYGGESLTGAAVTGSRRRGRRASGPRRRRRGRRSCGRGWPCRSAPCSRGCPSSRYGC